MKIDFSQVLKDFDGDPIKGPKEDITLGFICEDALLAVLKEETERPNADEYIRRFELARSIHKGKELDLKAEDIVLLKGRILKTRPALIYGLTSDMLEKKDGGTDKCPEHVEPGDEDSQGGGDSV
jgi:hypothetical protein